MISGTVFAVFTTDVRLGITMVLGGAGTSTTVAGVEVTTNWKKTGFRYYDDVNVFIHIY